ncbi:MAG: FHA domain-containing protein [Kiritimatiellae bacterium]|nr:FHA domain-containing protein [Kiritimatiellia bacterium]MDD5520848.1 FHA domain-containing protein [Kiritimatiellia bacterium]
MRNGKLLVLNGSLQGQEFVLNKEYCLIGTDPTCDIILNDSTISRRHCEIQFVPTGCMLRDLDSTNGTLVAGVRISEVLLDYRTEFCLGQTKLVFRSLKDTGPYSPGPDMPPDKRFDLSLAIQKFSSYGIGYSVADWGDVRHVLAAAVPRRGTTLAEQADDALRIIEAVISVHGAHGAIVQQAVFLPDPALIDECRDIIHKFYGKDLPATSYIAQPPCEGKLIAIEAMGLGSGRKDMEITRISEQLVIARHSGMAWTHCALKAPMTSTGGAYGQGISAFRQLKALLASVDMRMEQVFRTWIYHGGIVADEGAVQRYIELNRARTDEYQGIQFLSDRLPKGHPPGVYPASTGIGTEGLGLELSAIALATERPDVLAVPLENPRQTPAYDYSANYSPKSPKFSRAMAVTCGNYAMIFISGTASIKGSETCHVGDAAAQVNETLDNIAALISEENLSRHGLPGLGTTLAGMGLARVYIKRKEDYSRVRAICEKRLGELPTIYAVADVCRPDLLVEIEGMALSRNVLAMTQ